MQKWLENTRITVKVMSAIVVLGALAIGISAYFAYRTRETNAHYARLTKVDFPTTISLVRGNRYVSEMVQEGYAAAIYTDRAASAESIANISENRDAAEASLRKAANDDPAVASHVAMLVGRIDAIAERLKGGVEAYRSGDQAGGIRRLAQGDEMNHELTKEMVAFNNRRLDDAAAETTAIADRSESANNWALALSVLLTGLCGGIAYYVARNGVVRPVLNMSRNMKRLAGGDNDFEVPCALRRDEFGRMGEALLVFRDASREQIRLQAAKDAADQDQRLVVATLSKSLDRLAHGDLTVTVDAQFSGENAALKTNFNEAVGQLRELIGSVVTSAEQLRTGSIEIAQASEDLARRTESNAASLEQTAAGVGQMDGRLKATASAARDTVARADQTKVTVASGRSVADEAVQAMGRVSDSAKGIDSVIEGLDKIAFQTRVLAMNAAVEAGRAGEAGRGFAVVADLVSALAMRAEEEAKRARDQLTVTQADVVTAVEAVEKVDGALANISGDVEQVHSLLATIASDNQAQAGAITEINSAVASMDQATQQNAAMVEETSAAARNLLAEVNALTEQAGRFTTGAANAAPKPPKLPRAGKEGAYRSPVRALPADAIAALTPPAGDDDWREF
ncbi:MULTISPECIES: methyl-accepting chemotaxis protein [Sphingomonas]|uniref:methyl-accepting chemotaxis protein n=1 Tax=Sphingomonas TaxID=13687 RepID=UPI001F079F92|nr:MULTISPECIES: methyl-accepting chemotaxis protein [Sphingomonas]